MYSTILGSILKDEGCNVFRNNASHWCDRVTRKSELSRATTMPTKESTVIVYRHEHQSGDAFTGMGGLIALETGLDVLSPEDEEGSSTNWTCLPAVFRIRRQLGFQCIWDSQPAGAASKIQLWAPKGSESTRAGREAMMLMHRCSGVGVRQCPVNLRRPLRSQTRWLCVLGSRQTPGPPATLL